ncbi:bifunctional DNA primase/polymerase [Pseudooceanicola sp.]|uniref:bifunctional DNA primase/polymerase n=1 Tax=Pseudooceanicola sp. TaxID=1914328 RepID=UPI0035153116
MNALRYHTTPGLPGEDIARLHRAGFSLLPLGRGDDGKSPLVAFKGTDRLSLARVLAPMRRAGSNCYGIRLDGLAVIDCDVDDAGLVTEIEARFGTSAVHIRTPRGLHLYYRGSGGFPNLRSEGLPVDIKRGAASYVMGPGSVRPDGGAYIPVKGALGETKLPLLKVSSHAPRANIPTGARHHRLLRAAISMVESVDDPDELCANLRFIRDDECEDPATMPDEELRKIAEWAWSRRLEGKVYQGRNSEFRVHRAALDQLKGLPNASDAIALFVTLNDLHGHQPARVFPLDHKAMQSAGQTDLSRRRFREARRALEESRLLQVASQYRPGSNPRTYRLTRLHALAINVTSLHGPQSQGGGV